MASIVEQIGSFAVGRVEAVTAADIRIMLFDETPQATALNTGVPTAFPRINAYVLIPNETGAVVAVVREIAINRAKPLRGADDDAIVDLPFPSRLVFTIPFGTLCLETVDSDGYPHYALERGVPALPSVGDPVLLPSAAQLRAIVEAKTDERIVEVGTAPFAGNARVWVHPDKLFGRHVAVLGNTGSGKSCTVAGLVRWSLEAVSAKGTGKEPNTRFIILDPNGEYAQAFSDGVIPARILAVGGAGGAEPLTVPGWLWNGQEWAAFTAAAAGAQRPLLLRALRQLRNAGSTAATARTQAIRRYSGYVRQLEQTFADVPQSVTGFPRNREFGNMLEGLLALTHSDEAGLSVFGAETASLIAAISALRTPVEATRSSRHWTSTTSSGYNDFQPGDVQTVLAALRTLVQAHPIAVSHGEVSEDAPVKFDVDALPERLQEVALATGGQAVANAEPLVNRIQVMLGDSSLRPVIDSAGASSIDDWLVRLLGPSTGKSEPVVILDLSLVPADVIHIAVAVISRIIFEALQRHLKTHGAALPTVLVLEEAHSFVRKDADAGANAQASDICRQTFERIAREGRKFGLGMMLASQRPSELSPTVLAQCNSFLLHRIVNDVDQNLVRRLVPDALGGLLGELPTLPSQQAILLGWAVPTPVLVRLRDLERQQRPRSEDPKFWKTWLGDEGSAPDWKTIAAAWEQRPPPDDAAGSGNT